MRARGAGKAGIDRVEPIAGFILAGGASSRMGRTKALLEIGGEPMVVRTVRLAEQVVGSVAVVGGSREPQRFGLQVIEDDLPGGGPLGGIATALRVSHAPWNLILACDLPYLTRAWLEFLAARALRSAADVILPVNAQGAEPLSAVYHKRGEAAIGAAVRRGVRKVTDGLKDLRVETIEPAQWKAFDSEGLLFKNMNSPEDYEQAKARLEASLRP